MRKSHVVFLVLLILSVAPRPAAAADRLACQTAGIITKCPADAQLAAGSVLQSAFVPWSAAPAGSIPNSALVTTPPTLSSSTPSAIGTAAAGVGTAASRFDHVHALPAWVTATNGSASLSPSPYNIQMAKPEKTTLPSRSHRQNTQGTSLHRSSADTSWQARCTRDRGPWALRRARNHTCTARTAFPHDPSAECEAPSTRMDSPEMMRRTSP